MPDLHDEQLHPSYIGVPTYLGSPFAIDSKELKSMKPDIAVLGAPVDMGVGNRPGARFGPQSIRQASRHLRTNYHPNYDIEPFKVQQVADAGDIVCNPFNINEAIQQIEKGSLDL